MMKKTIKSLYLALATFLGVFIFTSANAQVNTSNTKIIAVVNKADWCPTCKANGPRVMEEVMPACKKLSVKFIGNDLTDENTKSQSSVALKDAGIFTVVKKYNGTGFILLVDSKTKKVIKKISVSEPSDKIIQEITEAQS